MAVISLFAELIDQYKIEQHLARKSYTDLYLAFDVDENRQVLLDVLRLEYARDEGFARRFTKGANAIAQVKHPNIAQIYQVGTTADGLPYVAQAHIDGYPLSQRLEQLADQGTPVLSTYALKLVRQLAEALLLANRLDMVHYELQPAHVLLKNVTRQTDDVVVLCDLFIPLNQRANNIPSEHAQIYLSPEQREGKGVEAASHVYSLGVILYELLVGHPPARPVQLWDRALRSLTAGATMLQRERDDLAAETYALVDRCLRREPRRRFQGMREFVEALDDALAAERLRVTNQAEQSAQGRHHPWGVVLTLLFLMVFLAASLMLLANGNGPMPTAEPTVVAIRGGDPPSAYPYPGDQGGEGGEATLESGGTFSDVPTRTPTATSTATPTATPTSTPRPSSTIAPTPTEEEMPAAAVSDTPAPQPAVRVVVPSASLRTGPGTDYRILDFLFEDEVVSVLAWNGEPESPWYVVLSGEGLVGWLAASTTEPVTAATEDNPLIVEGVPPAATIPVAPSPTATLTPTPTSTATPTPTVTLVVPVPDPPDDGGDGGEDVPPTVVPPTATELPADTPTATPPSLP